MVGWEDGVTLQCEGRAGIPAGAERERCLNAYFEQYPDRRQRAGDCDIAHIQIRPDWMRISDYRPGSFGIDPRSTNSAAERPQTIPNRTSGQSAARPQRPAKVPSPMTCPVNVSLSGGYPDGRTRRRAKNPPSLRRSEVYPFDSRQDP
jgi:hypothetical protein